MHTEIEDENCCEAFSFNSTDKNNKLILKNNLINKSPTKLKRINDKSSFKSVNKLIKLTSESINQLSGLLTTSLKCNVIKIFNSTNLISELNSNNCLNSCELTSSNLSNNLIMLHKNCLNCSTTNLTSLKNCFSSLNKQQICKLSIQNKSSFKLCASRSSAINDHNIINNMDLISIEFIKLLFLSLFKSIYNFTRNNQFIIVPLLLILCTIRVSDACSARSTPKPRPPIPEIRPNITFQTYQCPEAYAKWYCLNGATCFFVRIGESILYNCECADGYMGQRCEFKDLEGSYLQSREKVLIETAQVTGGLSVIVVLLMFIALIFFANYKKRKSNRATDEHANQFPFIT